MEKSRLIVASASPRRRELLEGAGLHFEVLSPPGEEESPQKGEAPIAFVVRAARAKALAAAALPQAQGAYLLAADTVVALQEKILGKPKNEGDARRMLELLSGRVHKVLTGFVLLGPKGENLCERCVGTEVEFAVLHPEELDWYLKTGEPPDKAGAYGIQGHGARFVRAVRGSYTNVVGLPLAEVLSVLRQHGVLARKS